MRTAIISDIHGNLEALQTVLADIDRRRVDEIVCLGDILGYGPNPNECVDLVAERCSWSLMGNHDYAVIYEPTNFNAAAKQAAFWTRDQLDKAVDDDPESGNRRWDFLSRVLQPRVRHQELYVCVHGSVRKPINEYLFESDPIEDRVKMKDVFRRIEDEVAIGDATVRGRCLVGHTHVPGVFVWTDEDEADFTRARNLGGGTAPADPLDLDPKVLDDDTTETDPFLVGVHVFDPAEKAIANPGSVGQPRDDDERASYAILDTSEDPHKIEFYRIPYDIDAVAAKIYAISELDDWLGDRLIEGR